MRKNILLTALVCFFCIFCAQAQVVVKELNGSYTAYPLNSLGEIKVKEEVKRATSNPKDDPIANGEEFFAKNADGTYSVIPRNSKEGKEIRKIFTKRPGFYITNGLLELERKTIEKREREAAKSKGRPIVDGSDINVQYTFESCQPLKQHMKRTFISEAMLKQVRGTSILENSKWNVNKVLNRLTAMLVLNGNNNMISSVSRSVVKHIKEKSLYTLLLETQTEDSQVMAFYHSTDKEKVDELLIFIFGKGDETNIIQMTGDLRLSDLGTILRISK